jgi:hypothetical protein
MPRSRASRTGCGCEWSGAESGGHALIATDDLVAASTTVL